MGSTVTVAGKEYQCIREGLADILGPLPKDDQQQKKTRAGGDEQSVFYNPIQNFNRDLSVLAMKVFAEEFTAQRAAQLAKRDASKKRREATKTAQDNNNKRKRDHDAEAQGDGATAEAHETKKMKTLGTETQASAIEATHSESNSTSTSTHHDPGGNAATVQPIAEKKTVSPRAQFRILDALSATGLRALRYAKEVPESTLITANDLSAEAVAAINRNIEYNDVSTKVKALQGNAAGHMYQVGTQPVSKLSNSTIGKYDAIDLDPYGTAAPFLDAAVQAVSDGGLLAVTCTDSAVFASVGYLEKTFSSYGGLPWKGSQSHEAGLRLIIHAVSVSAARYGLAIEPLLSLSIDYYVRIFIRVRKSPSEVKLLPGKTMAVFSCDTGCGAWKTQYHARSTMRENRSGDRIYHFSTAQGPSTSSQCEHCGFKTHLVGPMWGGYLHNLDFIRRILDKVPELDREVYTTIPRLQGMLNLALNEALLPDTDISPPTKSESCHNAASLTEKETKVLTKTRHRPPAGKPFERLDPALAEQHPFFISTSELSKVLHCVAPSDAALRGAFKGLGYRTTRSHTRPNSLRTDAPWKVIWEVMRAWVHLKAPVKEGAIKENTAGFGIWRIERGDDLRELEASLERFLEGDKKKIKAALAAVEAMKESRIAREQAGGQQGAPADLQGGTDEGGTEGSGNAIASGQKITRECFATAASGQRMPVVFDEKLGQDPDKGRYVRYQQNPRDNWGPQTRAK